MCNQIKDEAVRLRQDLEHQIEDLSAELLKKDIELIYIRENINTEVKSEELNKNVKGVIINEGNFIEAPLLNNDMNISNSSEALHKISYDPFTKPTEPSLDLKILMAKDESINNSSKEYEVLKEVNEALQIHVKQLLDEKKEMTEFVKRNLDVADEEKKHLEFRVEELLNELEEFKIQKSNMENDELQELLRVKEEIEREKKILQQKKNAFNEKLEKINEMQNQLVKNSEDIKEIEIKMRVKKKKLFFKKQVLEKEWKNMDEQKEQLAKDIQDIEHQWKSVLNIKEELIRASKEISKLNQDSNYKGNGRRSLVINRFQQINGPRQIKTNV